MLRLQSRRLIAAGIAALGLAYTPVPGSAVNIPGGGSKRSDCYMEFGVEGTPTASTTTKFQCEDGNPNCDQDNAVNGACDFKVSLCPNQTDLTTCTPAPPLTLVKVTPGSIAGILLPPTDLGGTTCGPTADIIVPLKGKKHNKTGKRVIHVKSKGSGKPKTDLDTLILICKPPNPGVTSACPVSTPDAACMTNSAGGPDEICFVTGTSGTDLDNGWTGISQDFPVPSNSSVKLCLSGCDASTNPLCTATGPTGAGSLNGPTFGPPLPLVAQAVPVCVINRYQPGDITAKINVQTGVVTNTDPLAVNLLSDVYLTQVSQVCPRCAGGSNTIGASGTCDGGTKQGQSCTVDSVITVVGSQGNPVYPLSGGCPPEPGQLAGTLNIMLRLTTGTSTLTGPKPCTQQPGEPPGVAVQDDNCNGSPCNATCTGTACASHAPDGQCIDAKGGLSQVCCAGSTITPCFPTAGGGSIIRTGNPDPPAPVWPSPTYPKTSTMGVLVTTFCEGATGTSVINSTTGLPGPGALILPGTQTLYKAP